MSMTGLRQWTTRFPSSTRFARKVRVFAVCFCTQVERMGSKTLIAEDKDQQRRVSSSSGT